MTELHIHGGVKLRGSVRVPGSKNACLALLSAVVLVKGRTTLHNVPRISDTFAKAKLLEKFGAVVTWNDHSLTVDCTQVHAAEADDDTVRSIRTSFFLLGPLLARVGQISLAAPGGCRIGARPLDYHLKGLGILGATVNFNGGIYYASAERLVGGEIYLDTPSPGATTHLMTTAVLAEGNTEIKNAAMEPEVVTLAGLLNSMGAKIEGAGTSTISIQGVQSLHETEFFVPADRMQAGTFLLAGAITGGDVTVTEIVPEHQAALMSKLREAGAIVTEGGDWVRVQAPEKLIGVRVKTMPYPGFPTDLQQPMSAVLALASGTSVVEETIYEGRTGHIRELNRLGADISVEGGRSALIHGVESLQGARVEASDLRAGAALVLAGLAAHGETYVSNVHFIDRGYESFEDLLRSLGANLDRVPAGESGIKSS